MSQPAARHIVPVLAAALRPVELGLVCAGGVELVEPGSGGLGHVVADLGQAAEPPRQGGSRQAPHSPPSPGRRASGNGPSNSASVPFMSCMVATRRPAVPVLSKNLLGLRKKDSTTQPVRRRRRAGCRPAPHTAAVA
jgi:hypothetical protein